MIVPKNKLYGFVTRELVPAFSPAIGTGVPLVIYEEVFTTLHYNKNILTTTDISISFLLAFLAYGYDRLRDAVSYDIETTSESKQVTYESINEIKGIYILALVVSFLFLNHELYKSQENYVFSLPLLLSFIYKDIKSFLGIYKPLFIGTMWASASIIIPCVMHDNSFDILKDPLCYVPCILSLASTSNVADIKDIKEDKEEGVQTFATEYGKLNTKMISLVGLFISSALYAYHPNAGNHIFFEIQNAILAGVVFFF